MLPSPAGCHHHHPGQTSENGSICPNPNRLLSSISQNDSKYPHIRQRAPILPLLMIKGGLFVTAGLCEERTHEDREPGLLHKMAEPNPQPCP